MGCLHEFKAGSLFYLLCKFHNTPVLYPAMHHFATEMCTFLEQNGVLWDICLMHCGICKMDLLLCSMTYHDIGMCYEKTWLLQSGFQINGFQISVYLISICLLFDSLMWVPYCWMKIKIQAWQSLMYMSNIMIIMAAMGAMKGILIKVICKLVIIVSNIQFTIHSIFYPFNVFRLCLGYMICFEYNS